MSTKKTMGCGEITPLLSQYQDNESAAEVRALIHAHLQTCTSCRTELLELQEMVAGIKQLPEVETDPYFTTQVMGKVLEKAMKPSRGFRRFPFLFPFPFTLPSSPSFSRVVYSLVFIIFLVLGFWVNSNSTMVQPSGTTGKDQLQQELQLVKVLVESQDLSLINIQDKTFALLVNGNDTGNGDNHEK
jgi:anti-sigma factor RsiW